MTAVKPAPIPMTAATRPIPNRRSRLINGFKSERPFHTTKAAHAYAVPAPC